MRKILKKILLGLLISTILLQTAIPTYAAPSKGSNSNDYRAEFIKIKKGQSLADIDTSQITADELRMVALFMSNFYVPFATAFDDEDEYKVKEKTVKALTSSCNFEKDTAERLVELVYKYTLETAKPLYFKADKTQIYDIAVAMMNGETNKGTGELNILPTLAYTEEKLAQGYSKPSARTVLEVLNTAPDNQTDLADDVYRMTYGTFMGASRINEKIYACWSDDNTYTDDESKRVFSTNEVTKDSYAMYADSLSYAKGVGSSFLTVKESDATSLNDESVISAFSVLSPLYVDWVGNIIMDDGVNRVVLLPACMNPYTFKVLSGDTGQRVNLISLLGMSKWNSNDVTVSDDKGEGSKSRFKYKVYAGENSLFTTKGFTSARGKQNALENYLDDVIFGKGNAQELRDVIQKYFALSGNANTLYFPKWDKAIDENSKDGTRAYLKDDSMVHANYVWLDNLQEYEWSESELSKFFHVGDISKDERNGTKATFSNIDDFGGIAASIGNSDDASLSKIYMTYLFAYSNYQKGSTAFKAEENLVDMAFNGDVFPQNADNKIDWGDIEIGDDNGLMDEIMSMVYYILHPKEGMRYVSVWAKNKISAVLLGWHEDMVGQATSNVSTGMTKYIGFTGYTTIPSLNDLSWTSWLLSNYNSIIVYLIIIISIILCCYVIVGHLTGQRALIGAFMFAVLAFIPPVAINATVNIVNTVCDTIYGSKFTYWALVQHQSYLQDLYAATTGGATPEDYRDFVLKSQYAEGTGDKAEEQTDNGYASVKLKWMSPKKDNYLASIIEEEQGLTGTDSNNVTSNLLGGMLSKQVSGEEFLDEPESLYLYRDYMNVTMYALKSYNLYSTFYGGSNGQSNAVDMGTGDYKLQVGAQWQGSNENKNIHYSSGISLQTMVYTNYEADSTYSTAVRNGSDLKMLSSVEAIRNGFMYNTMGADTDLNSKLDYYTKTNLAASYALNYTQVYADLYQNTEALKKDIANGTVEVGKDALRGYGLPQSYFNFTQSDLSKTDATNYSKEKLDYFYYGMYSESPFYFFNYNILDQMNATQDVNYQFQTSKDGGFKNLLLGNNLDYFFNYSDNAADGY